MPPIVLDVKMYAIADKTLVEPLKTLAAKKIEERAKVEWNTPAFADAVSEVYDCTPEDDTLRSIVVSTVIFHQTELLSKISSENVIFRKVLMDTELGAELALALASGKYKCPHCSRIFHASVDEGCGFSCPGRCLAKSVKDWAQYAV